MSDPAEPMLERRRRIVRAEIGRVAIELFAERGFDNVTVDDIAAAAGTSPRTFFRYFATKDDVVLDYERRLHDRLLAAFDAQPASTGAVTALREAFVTTSHTEPADRPRVVQLGRILATAPALRARARGERLTSDDALVERVARRLGIATDDVAARTIVSAMNAVAATEYLAWVHDGGHGDPSERIAAALGLLERGLGLLDTARRSERRKA